MSPFTKKAVPSLNATRPRANSSEPLLVRADQERKTCPHMALVLGRRRHTARHTVVEKCKVVIHLGINLGVRQLVVPPQDSFD